MSRFFQRRNHEKAHNDPVGNGSSCRPNFRSPDEHVGQIDHIDSQGEKAQEEQENNRLRVADNDPPEFDYPEVELIRTYSQPWVRLRLRGVPRLFLLAVSYR